MSLIDDALKRAQGTENLDDALRRGAAYPFMARNLQDRRRSRRALLLGFVGGGVLASLLAGGIVLWLAPRRAPEPAVHAAATHRPAASAPAAALPEVAVPPPVPVRPARPEPGSAVGRGSVPPAAERTASARPSPKPAVARPAEPAPPASVLGIVNGKAYPGEVALSDGRKIALDGIVFSESNPVAMIDGRVVSVGSVVGEFAVTRIEADRVQLQGQGIAFTLVVK